MAANGRKRSAREQENGDECSLQDSSRGEIKHGPALHSRDSYKTTDTTHVPKKQKQTYKAERLVDRSNNALFAGEAYNSNIFKLQVDELLASVTPRFDRFESEMTYIFQSLKAMIEQIPGRQPMTIFEAEKSFAAERIIIPFPEPKPKVDPNYLLCYDRPEHVNVTGSYALRTITQMSNHQTIDFVVAMPSAIFQEKDYLNHRYFAKRAYYLACLAAGLKKNHSRKFKMEYDLLHGIHYHPILILQPIEEDGSKPYPKEVRNCRIRIIPILSEHSFPENRLAPDKACLRTKSSTDPDGKLHPSPFYNGAILHDCHVAYYLKFQHNLLMDNEKYREACVLGRIWLKQRSLDSTIQGGGFGNFEWAVLMGLLLHSGGTKGSAMFSKGYSSYQLFKAKIQFLAHRDLVTTPQIIGHGSLLPTNPSSRTPMLFDAERNHNVLFKMFPWSYEMLRHEASVTLSSLKIPTFDQFESTFIIQAADPLCRFDTSFEIPLLPLLNRGIAQNSKSERLAKECQNLYHTIKTSLTSRARCVCIQLPQSPKWDIDKSFKVIRPGQKLIVGVLLDSSQIERNVDHGPSADKIKEATLFRQFWGEKAELRRYKDGRILESLIWNTQSGSMEIYRQILHYSFRRHYGAEFESQVRFLGGGSKQTLLSSASSAESAMYAGNQAFEDLRQTLREVEDLPLRVADLLPADPQLSNSSNISLSPGSMTASISPANAIVRFESSARWPDDLEAVQKTKVAFLIKMQNSLENSALDVGCKIGLENESKPLENQSFLGIICCSTLAVRIRIHHDREITLLERQLTIKSSQAEKLEIGAAIAKYKQCFIYGPAHCQAIQALSLREPFFSSTLKLVKQWFSNHLLSSHFSDELIEMFTARAFTNPFPWGVPASTSAGFCRTLVFISRWNWYSEPWIVNLASEEMTEAQVATATTRYQAWRKIDPALNRVVMFVASNIDIDGTTWTDHQRPAKVVAARLSQLTKIAVAAIKKDSHNLDMESLFIPSHQDYDFVLYTNNKKLHATEQRMSNRQGFKNLDLQNALDVNVVGHDAYAYFVNELEYVFSNALAFFHNPYCKDVVAGLWNPQTARTWKLKLGYSSAPATGGMESIHGDISTSPDDIIANKDAILNEITRMGGELIDKMEIRD